MSAVRSDIRWSGRRGEGGQGRFSGVVLVALSLGIISVVVPARHVVAQDSGAAGFDFFETKIRPLLIEHCYSCHSEEAARLRGDLRLDTKEGLRQGGALGPAIEPGDPENSLLIEVVRYEDPLLQMPPKGKLSDQEIAALVRWVEMGAPDPRTEEGESSSAHSAPDMASAAEHWAFQPPVEPEVPEVEDRSWPKSELDHFILAKLESQGLSPAPPADRRTLIRRATIDLIGLPPTPEEVAAFLDDDRPDDVAFEALVDRLLASPHYGERWGRHWLDVARYADSNGLDENVAHGNAWRYRDYVVNSFNRDKPYDRFLLEQLAGDLLPEPADPPASHDRLLATGFLALGPKVLAEPDPKKMEMDIIDEQLDTVGRTFMGLTIGCARCHDHKFDPIPTSDYYALAGIFKSTRTMESYKIVARWHENPLETPETLALQAAHEEKVKAAKQEIEQFVEQANQRLIAEGGEGYELPETPEESYSDGEKAELKRLREALKALKAEAPEMPSAMGVTEGTVTDVPIHIRGNHLTLGEVVPRRVPTVISGPSTPVFDDSQSGRLELARWMIDKDHPLTARVMVNRIWRWHFGRGLVETTDNFGMLGATPSHPGLLDWLALRFIEEGWSIKEMHRVIMRSSAYQMSSRYDPEAAEADPENRLLWRMSVRRLEAEVIRDALLAVAGKLDRRLGGSLLTVKNRGYFFNHTSEDKTEYDSNRRSVYLPVVRNHLYDGFQLFDYSDASVLNGNRATTTVAPQALFLMNSDLVLDSAEALADSLLEQQDLEDRERIEQLYDRAYARPPSPEEVDRAESYLERFSANAEGDDRRREAWQALCQTIMVSDEFIYVR